MKEKLSRLKLKMGSFGFGGLGKFGRVVRALLMSLMSGVLLLSVAASVWVYRNPINSQRAQVLSHIQNLVGATAVYGSQLNWAVNPARLSVGLRISDFTVKGLPVVGSFQSPSVIISVQPIKVLLGKVALRVYGQDALVHLSMAREEAPPAQEIPAWILPFVKRLNLSIELNVFKLALLSKEGNYGEPFFDGANLQVGVSRFPGDIKGSMFGVFSPNDSKYSIKGPANMNFSGVFQVAKGKTVGLKIEQLSIGLNKAEIVAPAFIEKSPYNSLNLTADAQCVFGERGQLEIFQMNSGILNYQKFKSDFSLSFRTDTQQLTVDLKTKKQDLKEIYLPFRHLNKVPVDGSIEGSASLSWHPGSFIQGVWKYSLSSFSLLLTKVPAWFDPSSSGSVQMSLYSEGELAESSFETPRTELQFNATEAQIEMGEGRYLKPAGDPLAFLLRLEARNDVLSLKKARLDFNNLILEGKGEMKKFFGFMSKGQSAPAKIEGKSNIVSLAAWTAYNPFFRAVPMQGQVEINGNAEAEVNLKNEDLFRNVSWRVGRLSLSKLQGTFDQDSYPTLGLKEKSGYLRGPFSFDFFFQGRGSGDLVNRGTLISQVDLSRVDMQYGERLRKKAGIPLVLDISVEQTANVLAIRRGNFRFHELGLAFEGDLRRGSRRSFVDVRAVNPVKLSDWSSVLGGGTSKDAFDGDVSLDARLLFREQGLMEGGLSWKDVGIEGEANIKNLSYKFSSLRTPITRGRGKFILGRTSLTLPSFSFETEDLGKASLSGELSLAKSSAVGDKSFIWKLLGGSPVDVSGQLEAERFDPRLFSVLPKSGQLAENMILDEALQWENAVKATLSDTKNSLSKLRLRTSVGRVDLANLKASSFLGIVNWERGQLRVEPMSAVIWNSRVLGSFVYDAKPFLDRVETPDSLLTFKFVATPFEKLQEYLAPATPKWISGKFSGEARVVGKGFESSAILKSLRGRVLGRISEVKIPAFGGFIPAFQEWTENSPAKDYLIGNADYTKCYVDSGPLVFDGRLENQELGFQKAEYGTDERSQISFVGQASRGGELNVKGRIRVGPECVQGPPRGCLALQNEPLSFPFSLGGPISKAKLSLDLQESARKIASCMSERIQKEAGAKNPDSEAGLQDKVRRPFKGI